MHKIDLLLSEQGIKIPAGEDLQLAAPGSIVHPDISAVAVVLHGHVGQGALFRVGDVELLFVLVVFLGEIILGGMIHHHLALAVLADAEMVVDTDEIDLREAHIGGNLSSGVHTSAGVIDAGGNIIAESEGHRVLGILRKDIEVPGTADGDIMPPVQLDGNKLFTHLKAVDHIDAAAQHFFILGDVEGGPPGGLVENIVDAVEAEGDLPCLVELGQILCPQAWSVTDEEATAAFKAIFVCRQLLTIGGRREMLQHPGTDEPGLNTGADAIERVHN